VLTTWVLNPFVIGRSPSLDDDDDDEDAEEEMNTKDPIQMTEPANLETVKQVVAKEQSA
jgi:hypothetical protein